MSEPLKKTEEAEDKGAKQISEMSPEDLEKNKLRFLFRQGMISEDPDAGQQEQKPPKKDDEKPAPAAPAETEGKVDDKEGKEKKDDKEEKTAKTEEGKETPAKPRARRQESRSEITSEVIREAVQAGATAAIEATKATTAQETPASDVDLTPKDKKTIEVIRFMEENNRAPKGSAEKTIQFWGKENDYIAQWQEKNPDKEYDENDSEHSQFYSKNEPAIDPDDFDQAKEDRIIALAESKAEAKFKAARDPEIEKISFERQLEKLEPEIEKRANAATVALIEKASPDLAKVLGEDGKRSMAKDTFEKLAEEDPGAAEILQDESERLQLLLTEYELLAAFPTRYKPDVGHVMTLSSGVDVLPHRQLIKIINTFEADLAALPKEETERGGKAFLPQPELIERERRIHDDKSLSDDRRKAAIRDLHGRYWSLTNDDIRSALVAEHVESAEKRIAKMTTIFDRKSSKGKPASGKTTQSDSAPPHKTAQELPSRGAPPSVSSSSDKVNNSGSGKNGGATRDEVIEQKMGW